MKRIEQAGLRYGRLFVVSRAENAGKHVRWYCDCDCGSKMMVVSSTHLSSGHTTSCGCLASEVIAARNVANAKRGMWKTPEFGAWASMQKRCYLKSNNRYVDYGGRGIEVCVEWRESFKAFFAHIGSRPTPAHSLDRIRNAEGYVPGNVRWATAVEQNNNRRSNVTMEIDGVVMTATQISNKYGLSHRTVCYRIQAGKSASEVVAPSNRGRAT